MQLLGVKNITAQTVPALGLLGLGAVYRRYCTKDDCGFRTFEFTGDSISIQHPGMYLVTVTATFTAPAAGDVTLQIYEDGVAVPGALTTETITTADTETRTVSFDYTVLVNCTRILNTTAVAKNITVVNTGVEADFSNIVVNVLKVS